MSNLPKNNKWDNCPIPFKNETFSSWFTRLSKENYSESFDILNMFHIHTGDIELFYYLNSKKIIKLISPYLSNYIDFSVFEINLIVLNDSIKYCPRCLKRKNLYFRKDWYDFHKTKCVKHNRILRSSCPYCGSKVKFWLTKWNEEITNCYNCHNNISDSVTPIVNRILGRLYYFEDITPEIKTKLLEIRKYQRLIPADFNRKQLQQQKITRTLSRTRIKGFIFIELNSKVFSLFYNQYKVKPKDRLHWTDRRIFEFTKLTFFEPVRIAEMQKSSKVAKKTVINTIKHLLAKNLLIKIGFSDRQSKKEYKGFIRNFFYQREKIQDNNV